MRGIRVLPVTMTVVPSSLRNLRVTRARAEAMFWSLGVLAVAIADPNTGGLISVCPFEAIGSWIGLSFCPGCGLGHAVGFLVRGDLSQSMAAHPLAIPAVLTLTLHVRRLLGSSRPESI